MTHSKCDSESRSARLRKQKPRQPRCLIPSHEKRASWRQVLAGHQMGRVPNGDFFAVCHGLRGRKVCLWPRGNAKKPDCTSGHGGGAAEIARLSFRVADAGESLKA